jgi:creatinine amidohydrolase
MNPDSLRDAFGRCPRLIIPVGTCEPHGPHLPLGCGTTIIERLADDLSAEFGIVRAPTIEYGVNDEAAGLIPGNASVRRKTLRRWINDLLPDWEAAGIEEFLILTMNGNAPHQEALGTVITERARVRVIDILSLDLSSLVDDPHGPIHGGEADTSLMLHLAPSLVRMDLARDFILPEEDVRRYRRGSTMKLPAITGGSVGRPTSASAAKGARIYEFIKDRIRKHVLTACLLLLAHYPAPAYALTPAAQEFLDRGTFIITQAGGEIGREEFAIRPTAGRQGQPGILAVSTVRLRDREQRSALELTGTMAPLSVQVTTTQSGRIETQFTAQLNGTRLSSRLSSRTRESSREFPVRLPLVLLADDVASAFYFVPRGDSGSIRPVTVVRPRDGRGQSADVVSQGTDSVLIGERQVKSHKFELRLPDGDRRLFWITPNGDLLRVASPSRDIAATRSELPRR